MARRRSLRLASRTPLALELLYLPHWLIVHETLAPAASARRPANGPPSNGRLAVLVCRLSGQAAHIRLESIDVRPGPEPLPPHLERSEAEAVAADFVDRVLLIAARGRRRRERGRLLCSEPCGYPYWVGYLEGGRRIGFRALDAVSGKRAGAAARSAIARGIATAG